MIPSLADAALSPALATLVDQAKELYHSRLARKIGEDSAEAAGPGQQTAWAVAAPGRVNLIGEHTDYTGGFVLPLAIDYSTVIYGTGYLHIADGTENLEGAGVGATLLFGSCSKPDVEEITIDLDSSPPETPDWTAYVAGTVFQYLSDLPKGSSLRLAFAISGDVPLGSGLSSSASLEVAVARFVEAIIGEKHAFSSEKEETTDFAKARAIRCQRAENTWCKSPCGIMDQFVSSAASDGSLLLIDCRSLEYWKTKMAEVENPPVLVVTNSLVQHDIAGGEYPNRVAQCKTATAAISKVNRSVKMLRDATMSDIEKAKDLMEPIIFKRCKHVVTENVRTVAAKEALESGDWERVGELMNQSHSSMRDDYEVSCEEIDILVDLAQSYEGVYGSRLTGGGFGGCTVTFVKEENAEGLVAHLKQGYKSKTGKDCDCFVTTPAQGARVLAVDTY